MGERRNDGGTPGRRGVHPDHTSRDHRTAGQDRPGSASASSSGRPPARDAVGPRPVGIEALLAEALARGAADAGFEQRAVAAFREARDAGAQRTRTRRRDDWRPRERRLGRFSVKAALSVLVAGLSLGGAAVAGMGAAGTTTDGSRDGGGRPTTPAVTSALSEAPSADRSPAAGPDVGSGPTAPEHPVRAKDTEAHCRAYEKAEGRGKALESTAWKRLVEAAGGAANVDAHCAGQLRSAPGEAEPGATGAAEPGATGAPRNRPGDAGNSGNGFEDSDNDASGRQGASARPGGEKKP